MTKHLKIIQRFFIHKKKIFRLEIDELYSFSLLKTQGIRPWAVNENGIFIGLKFRYEFVNLYLDKDGELEEKDFAKTGYFKSLQRNIRDSPRDGGRDWVYENPKKQVKRFMYLIDSFYINGYIGEKHSEVLNRFCIESNPHIEKRIDGKIIMVNYKGRPFEGLISVRPHKGYYSVWNGTHRLAILHAFHERSLFNENKIPVILH